MKKNKLYVLTSFFPYCGGETFLENEWKFWELFDEVIVIPLNVNNESLAVEFNNEKYRIINIKIHKKIKYVLFSLFSKNVYKEIGKVIKKKKTSILALKKIMSMFAFSHNVISEIKKINLFNKEDNNFVYSYWLHNHAYIASSLKKIYKIDYIFSRCHGFDLYEYREKDNYLPFREYILSSMDKILPISSDGYEYLKKFYPLFEDKFLISRLGTKDYFRNNFLKDQGIKDKLLIVSCSSMIPLKRLNLIIAALSEIKDINIEWVHFGSGCLYDDIIEQSKNLDNNINAFFYKQVPNNFILEFYANNKVDVFINVSEYEGIPVSIMEAISFGIPVIATNVGGNSEIVIDNFNGFMLEKNFKVIELSEMLKKIFFLDVVEVDKYRKNSRFIWETKYNAEVNYNELFQDILSRDIFI